MAHNYESEFEEQDDGYSIPKILVAVLLLVLIGAGTYIYYQQRKLDTSISYLLNSKKQAEKELNEMIEKYNLAIEDNGELEGDLIDERDRIIRYRDSIKNIKQGDLKKETDFKKTISKLKKESSVESVSTSADDGQVLLNDLNNNTESTSVNALQTITTSLNDTANANNKKQELKQKTDSSESVEKKRPKIVKNTTFKRVEIPPTYPGCTGTPILKKKCFEQKIKKHLSRKFNTSIIDYLDLEPGAKKIWINFDVNERGEVVNVIARAPKNMPIKAKTKLEAEAIRVIKKLPKMNAAIQNKEPVSMNYKVPLTFMVK